MDLSKIKLFPHFPDSPEVRGDVADYYFEVQRFDKLVADSIAALEEAGELDNTIIVMSGDHGMPSLAVRATITTAAHGFHLSYAGPRRSRRARSSTTS